MKTVYLLIGGSATGWGIKEVKSDMIPVMTYAVHDGDLQLGYYPCSQVFTNRNALEDMIVDLSEKEAKENEGN